MSFKKLQNKTFTNPKTFKEFSFVKLRCANMCFFKESFLGPADEFTETL